MPTTVRAFTFDNTRIHAIRRDPAPEPMEFTSASPGARYDVDLENGPDAGLFPIGTVFALTMSVVDISGIVPGLFFVSGGVQTSTTAIDSVGDDQVVTMDPTTEETNLASVRALTGTLATWEKLIIDATIPD